MSEEANNVAVEVQAETVAEAAVETNPMNDLIAQMTANTANVNTLAATVQQIAAQRQAPTPVAVPEPDPFAGVDPDTLQGARLAQYIEHRNGQKVSAQVAAIQASYDAKFQVLQGALQTQALQQTNAQIEAVRAKDPAAFEKLRPTMAAMWATPQYKALGIEDLFALAKTKAPGTKAPAAVTQPRVNPSSEKPTHSAARPPARVAREVPLPTNVKARTRILVQEAYADAHSGK